MPLKIVIPATNDFWDAENEQFINMKEQVLHLEHSLISLSKWERKIKKPFLSTENKTAEEWLYYVKCMTLNQVNDLVYNFITPEMMEEILDYIGDPMTATTFSDFSKSNPKSEIVTSEIIYYNMFSFGIPIELEKWHLNSLIALIKVFSIKSGGTKKMSKSEAAAFQRSINESRLAKNRRR